MIVRGIEKVDLFCYVGVLFQTNCFMNFLKPNLDLIGIVVIMKSNKKNNLSNIAGLKFDGKV